MLRLFSPFSKMMHHCSLASIIVHLFRASLLFVALLSTFYVHLPFSPPLFSVLLLISSFMYKKITSCGPKKLPENEVIKGLQTLLIKPMSSSQDHNDFTYSIFSDHLAEKSSEHYKGDEFEFGSTYYDTSSWSLESISEDVEEDCLIEIALEDPQRKRHYLETELMGLQQPCLEDFLSDVNEISGEDNLFEIDISMGSIRQSASLCQITV